MVMLLMEKIGAQVDVGWHSVSAKMIDVHFGLGECGSGLVITDGFICGKAEEDCEKNIGENKVERNLNLVEGGRWC
eukprot:scaffold10878_cov108-Skeletonema_dohrnii-CCMP3373.AAC.4